MPTIEGVLEKARKTTGWLNDLKIVVDGKTFYRRLWKSDRGREIRGFIGKAIQNKGKNVCVEYERRRLISTDIFIEKICLGNLSVPIEYNEIISIDYDIEQ